MNDKEIARKAVGQFNSEVLNLSDWKDSPTLKRLYTIILSALEESKTDLKDLLDMIPKTHTFGGAGEAYGILTDIVLKSKHIRKNESKI